MLLTKGFLLMSQRFYSKAAESVPLITVPVYLRSQIKKLRAKNDQRRLEEIRTLSRMGNRKVPIITSPQKPELNHYLGRMYDSKKELPLITLSWKKGKYRGHSFKIHKHSDHPCLLDPSIASFGSLGLKRDMVELLERNGFKTPSTIQEDAIPVILNGENVVCCAETGSGKTLAYMAPLLQLVRQSKQTKTRPGMAPLALVLLPSRELALQISEIFCKIGEQCSLNVCSLVPGINLKDNLIKAKEQNEVDIVIATIGAFGQLVKSGVFSVSYVDHIVVDEADTLLDNSFIDTLTYLMKDIMVQENFTISTLEVGGDEGVDDERNWRSKEGMVGAQLLLVGATLPRRLEETFGSLVDVGSLTWVRSSYVHRLPPHLTHNFIRMGKEEKHWNLLKLVETEMSRKNPLIIFGNTTKSASWISHYLDQHNLPNVSFHKGIHDQRRKENFYAFQEGKVDVICCSDLGSRGLDTTRAKHVVNFDFPRHMSDYIHRSGRTGRLSSVSQNCQVTNFICSKYEIPLLQQIEAAARRLKPLPNVDANISQKYEEYGYLIESRKAAMQ